MPGMTQDTPPIAATLRHYGRVTFQLTELDDHDAVFDRETATLHIDPSADLRPAIRAVLKQLNAEFDRAAGEVERAFTVVHGANALAAEPRPRLRLALVEGPDLDGATG